MADAARGRTELAALDATRTQAQARQAAIAADSAFAWRWKIARFDSSIWARTNFMPLSEYVFASLASAASALIEASGEATLGSPSKIAAAVSPQIRSSQSHIVRSVSVVVGDWKRSVSATMPAMRTPAISRVGRSPMPRNIFATSVQVEPTASAVYLIGSRVAEKAMR